MELRRPQYELEIWRLHESRALGACVEERHSVCSNFEKSSVHESFFQVFKCVWNFKRLRFIFQVCTRVTRRILWSLDADDLCILWPAAGRLNISLSRSIYFFFSFFAKKGTSFVKNSFFLFRGGVTRVPEVLVWKIPTTRSTGKLNFELLTFTFLRAFENPRFACQVV